MKSIAANTWIQGAIIGIICFFSFFVYLGANDVNRMEARNFITAREMVIDSHWLIPTMNGEIRLAKPPLPTWITAIARIAGKNTDNLGILRLPASMMASLMVFALWGFIRTVSEDLWLPIIAAMIFATNPIVIEMGRRGTWDIYSHSFMMLGIWSLSYGLNKKESAYGIFAIVGALLSFSFMSKGPVAFYSLLVPFLVGYIAVFGLEKIRKKWKALLLAFVLFLILSTIWPGIIYFQYPDILIHVIIQETAAWSNRHIEPFYFYAPFAAYTGIWMIFVIAGLIKPYAGKKIASFYSYRFIIIWLVLCLLFLSILPEKKERYLLPAILPMSALAGCLWRHLIQAHAENRLTKWDTRCVMMHTLLGFIASIVIPAIIIKFGVSNRLLSMGSGIGWSMVFILTSTIILVLGMKKAILQIFISSLTLVCLFNMSVLPVYFKSPLYKHKQYIDNHPLRSIRQIDALNGLKFYSTGDIDIRSIWDVGVLVRPWNPQCESLPSVNEPIALISRFYPTIKMPSKYLNEIEITLLEKYPYPSKKTHPVIYLTLISPKHYS